MPGYRILKNWLINAPAATKMIPMNQARKVPAGMEGSSWLSTTARTSAYGEFCLKGYTGFREVPARWTDDNHQGSLNFELLVDPLVLNQVILQNLFILVAASGFKNTRGEVRVVFVLSGWSVLSSLPLRGDRHTSSKIRSITPSISSGVMALAYSVASMISGPRARMVLSKTFYRTDDDDQ